MGMNSKYETQDERSRRLQEEKAEMNRKYVEEQERALRAYQSKILQLVSRHSEKYLPYRTTCPKDIKYSDLLNKVDTKVLMLLLNFLVEDQLLIQRILSCRYDNVSIYTKKPAK